MSPAVDRVAVAVESGIDWDRWKELSDEAKGIHLAYYREKRAMEAWASQEQERKALLRQISRKGKK